MHWQQQLGTSSLDREMIIISRPYLTQLFPDCPYATAESVVDKLFTVEELYVLHCHINQQ
jgi:hypothetical protein